MPPGGRPESRRATKLAECPKHCSSSRQELPHLEGERSSFFEILVASQWEFTVMIRSIGTVLLFRSRIAGLCRYPKNKPVWMISNIFQEEHK